MAGTRGKVGGSQGQGNRNIELPDEVVAFLDSISESPYGWNDKQDEILRRFAGSKPWPAISRAVGMVGKKKSATACRERWRKMKIQQESATASI